MEIIDRRVQWRMIWRSAAVQDWMYQREHALKRTESVHYRGLGFQIVLCEDKILWDDILITEETVERI